MGRLLALILGGLALVLYAPYFVLDQAEYAKIFTDIVGAEWYGKIMSYGPGTFAGLAMILLSVRGRD
jgi:hypothetical protein